MRRGPSPLDRRRRVRGRLRSPREAKPKRSHACVANPLRVDRGRPHQNQGKPIRERGLVLHRKQGLPKRTYLVPRIAPTRRLLRELSDSRHSRSLASRTLGVMPDPSTCDAASDRTNRCVGRRFGCLRQGWQPARGKTRYGASAQPTARPGGRRPISCLKVLRRQWILMNCEQRSVSS